MPEYDEWGNEIPTDTDPPPDNGPAPPPQTTNPPAAVTPGHTTLSPQQYVEAWRQQHPNLKLNQANSQAAWDQLAKDMQAVGFPVTLDTRPDGMHKGIMLSGQFVKLADGNDNAIWLPGGNAPNGPQIDQSYLAPFTQSFKDFYPQAFAAGGAEMPGAFKAPTADSILQDPSYQFREGRLKGSIENSAAARGLINSGGTIDSILNNVGNFASQEYGNIWNRDFNLWNTNYQHSDDAYNRAWQQYMDSKKTFYDNQDRPFDKIYKGIDTGYGASA